MNYRNVLNKKYNEEIPGSGPALLHEVQCLLDITVTVEIELKPARGVLFSQVVLFCLVDNTTG